MNHSWGRYGHHYKGCICPFSCTDNGQVLWLFFALAWGTTRLFFARYFGADYRSNDRSTNTDVHSELDKWSFGQWLPVILLLLPILSVGEGLYSK